MVGGVIQPWIFNISAHLIWFDMVFIMCKYSYNQINFYNQSIKDLKQLQKKCPNELTIIFNGHFKHKIDHF